jgi:hypothetical protein
MQNPVILYVGGKVENFAGELHEWFITKYFKDWKEWIENYI